MQPSRIGMSRLPAVGALLLLSTCAGLLGQGVVAGRAILSSTAQSSLVDPATLMRQIAEDYPSFMHGAETAAHRRRLSSDEGARKYQAMGQLCSGDGTEKLLRMDCPDEGCQEACSRACDAQEACEAFETKSEVYCVLYTRCEVAEVNNLPRTVDGNLATDYVRIRAWNTTVRRSTANVCIRGCPASIPDYVVTRDYLRSCNQDSVKSTRDLSEACAPGDEACAFSACADFCRPELSCAEFSVTTDLLTCELQDGSCVPFIDIFANKFQGAFRGETAAKKLTEMLAERQKELEAQSLQGGPTTPGGADGNTDGDSSEDSSAVYPGGDSPSEDGGISEARSAASSKGRSYAVAGKKCVGSPTRELYTARCAAGSTKASCNRACADLCDGEGDCEAYMTNRLGICALYRRCTVTDALSATDSEVHVCIDQCPATTYDYYVTRQKSRSCGFAGTLSARDMRLCDGNRLCSIIKCANFCRADPRCRDFALTDDMETCKLTDGSCQTSDDSTDVEFVGRLGRSRVSDNDDDGDSTSSGSGGGRGSRIATRGSTSLFNNRDSSGFEDSEESLVPTDDPTDNSRGSPGAGTQPKTASVQEVDGEQIQGDAEDDVEEIEDADDEIVEEEREQRREETSRLDSDPDRPQRAINTDAFREEIDAKRPGSVRPASRPNVRT